MHQRSYRSQSSKVGPHLSERTLSANPQTHRSANEAASPIVRAYALGPLDVTPYRWLLDDYLPSQASNTSTASPQSNRPNPILKRSSGVSESADR